MIQPHGAEFEKLIEYLCRVPAVSHTETPSRGIGSGKLDGGWWIKFSIDIDHPIAWHVVQELGFVLNYISLNERLPTIFKPVSPPPYLNGGPREFLSWVVECDSSKMTPEKVAEVLEGRLPRPVEDEAQWLSDDDDDSSVRS